METLTLARYVLEMSLMDYDIISLRESEVAAASLLVALRMKSAGDWVRICHISNKSLFFLNGQRGRESKSMSFFCPDTVLEI